MDSSSPSKLLRIAQVSELTTLAKSTINLWVAQGKFPKPLPLSKTIKVWRLKDVIYWIDKQYGDEREANTSEEPTPSLRIVNS